MISLDTAINELLTKELSGLCSTCVYYRRCAYRKKARKIIIQCELFENQLRSPETEEWKMDIHETSHPDNSVKGLCSDCSKFSNCQLPKDSCGVWHCEEYE